MDILDDILNAILKLDEIAKQINNESPKSHAHLKPIINSIIIMLVALGKSKKEHGSDFPICSDEETWQNCRRVVYRTSVIMLNIGISNGFFEFTSDLPCTTDIEKQRTALEWILKNQNFSNYPNHKKSIIKLLKQNTNRPSGFYERIEFLAKQINDKNNRVQFKNFFYGLRVLRNKCAHKNAEYSESDNDKLILAGLKNMISPDNTPSITPKDIVSLVEKALENFDLLYGERYE